MIQKEKILLHVNVQIEFVYFCEFGFVCWESNKAEGGRENEKWRKWWGSKGFVGRPIEGFEWGVRHGSHKTVEIFEWWEAENMCKTCGV